MKQLRYFQSLAEHRHFGRAAEACGVSQPALSMQIKELEEMLGSVLIERNARQIQMTHLGKEFAVRAKDILRSVDELGELTRLGTDELAGQMRIGIIPTIAPYLLPVFIGKLHDKYPSLDVHIRETQTQKLIEELSNGKLDAAIVALPVSEPSFDEIALFSEEFVFVRPIKDVAKDAANFVPNADDLRQMKLLLLEEGHCFRDQALSFCDMHSARPREVLDASSLSTLVQLVGAGIGVTLIPEMAVGIETRSADVSVAYFNEPAPTRHIGMIWRKTNPLAQQLLQISDIVRHCAAQLRPTQ